MKTLSVADRFTQREASGHSSHRPAPSASVSAPATQVQKYRALHVTLGANLHSTACICTTSPKFMPSPSDSSADAPTQRARPRLVYPLMALVAASTLSACGGGDSGAAPEYATVFPGTTIGSADEIESMQANDSRRRPTPNPSPAPMPTPAPPRPATRAVRYRCRCMA